MINICKSFFFTVGNFGGISVCFNYTQINKIIYTNGNNWTKKILEIRWSDPPPTKLILNGVFVSITYYFITIFDFKKNNKKKTKKLKKIILVLKVANKFANPRPAAE